MKYDHSALEPAVDIVGRLTLSILAALTPAGAEAVALCVPVECTDINTAARESSTSAASYVQSGNGHLYLGIVVLDWSCLLP